jgi:hypothetical protein
MCAVPARTSEAFRRLHHEHHGGRRDECRARGIERGSAPAVSRGSSVESRWSLAAGAAGR